MQMLPSQNYQAEKKNMLKKLSKRSESKHLFIFHFSFSHLSVPQHNILQAGQALQANRTTGV